MTVCDRGHHAAVSVVPRRRGDPRLHLRPAVGHAHRHLLVDLHRRTDPHPGRRDPRRREAPGFPRGSLPSSRRQSPSHSPKPPKKRRIRGKRTGSRESGWPKAPGSKGQGSLRARAENDVGADGAPLGARAPIASYGEGGFGFAGGLRHAGSVLILADGVYAWDVGGFRQPDGRRASSPSSPAWRRERRARTSSCLGVGVEHLFPSVEIRQAFRSRRVGLEVMTTGAAMPHLQRAAVRGRGVSPPV